MKAGKSTGFEKILYQVHGDEPPEEFVIWVKDVNDKVVTSKPDWELIFSSLIVLSNKASNAGIHAALTDFTNLKLVWGDYGPICKKPTQKKLLKMITLSNGIPMAEVVGQSLWDAFLKKPTECNPLFLEEIIFRLEE